MKLARKFEAADADSKIVDEKTTSAPSIVRIGTITQTVKGNTGAHLGAGDWGRWGV